MTRFGRYNIGMNRKVKPLNVIISVIAAMITLFVGEKIINSVFITTSNLTGTCHVTSTNGMFYQVWSFLGITNSCQTSTNGILGVVGVITFAIIVLNFVKVTKM